MAHFARVESNFVVDVIVVSNEALDANGDFPDSEPSGQAFIESLGLSGTWLQTSYNTRGGVHYDPETGKPSPDQSKAFRGNYAGIDYKYDAEIDAFIPLKPSEDATFDESTYSWTILETENAE